ncbi:hypothetical protein QCA50_004400 [Cerrena zonata]|uniref:Uncharacterized protein n=1 Tax=Cerrena zonata TaxID=2478898 RepID=A0AAW0GJC6_9APHY
MQSDSLASAYNFNVVTSQSANLSLVGQIILYTLLALLAVVFIGGCYHMCTRSWLDRDDIESPSRFEQWSSTQHDTIPPPIPIISSRRVAKPKSLQATKEVDITDIEKADTEKLESGKFAVDIVKVEVIEVEAASEREADRVLLPGMCTSSSRASSISSDSCDSPILKTPELPTIDAVPTIVFQTSDSGPNIPPSTTCDFPLSASSLEIQMLLATHAHLQVGPDVKPETLLKVPTMSWTGRILEPGEPELPSSCSLTEENDFDAKDWDESDDSICLIYDLTRPLTPMPSTPRDLDEAVTSSLVASLSLDLDSILLAAEKRFGDSPEYGRAEYGLNADISESIDEDSIYVGIVPMNDKPSRNSTDVVISPTTSS